MSRTWFLAMPVGVSAMLVTSLAPAQEAPREPSVPPDRRASQAAVLPEEVTAGALMGLDVRGKGGESLGAVRDLVLDPRNGRISQVIIAAGGFLGIGEKRVAVPWEEVRLTPEGVSVAMTPDDIREAEAYGAEQAVRPGEEAAPGPAPAPPPAD